MTSLLLTPAMAGDCEPDRDVDMKDFAVFATAWKSRKGDSNWNVYCDVSQPPDGRIDGRDIAVFVANYLKAGSGT